MKKIGGALARPAMVILSGALVMVLVAHHLFSRLVRRDVAALLTRAEAVPEGVVTAQMLAELPVPLRRYLTDVGVVGRPLVRSVHLTQKGRMHPGAQQPWMALDATQYYTVCPPGFVWDGTLHLGPLPLARARDHADGHGHMLIRAVEGYPLADARGEEMDQASLMRYLQEMAYWFPAALLGENVACSPIDDRSVRVTLTDHGRSVSGTLVFDAQGRLADFIGQRYRSVAGGYSLDTWSCPVTEYGELAGLRLPVRGKALWKLPEGDLEYIDVSIIALEYNVRDGGHRAELDDDVAREAQGSAARTAASPQAEGEKTEHAAS